MGRACAVLLFVVAVVVACSGPETFPVTPSPSGATLDVTATPEPSATPVPTPTTKPSPTPTSPPTPVPTPVPSPTPVPEPTPTPVVPTPSPVLQSPAPGAVATVVSRVETDELVIALTFDAGADRGYAEQILDTLAAEGVKATFGMTGRWAEANPDLVRRMVDEGHQLINHTYSHPSFTGRSTGQSPLSTAERLAELRRLETVVAQVTGSDQTMRPYFRPPYGDYDDSVLSELPTAGYTVVVMWSVDSLGWNGLSAQEIVDRCLAGATPGGIILMHVGAQSQDAQALPQLIASLRERGYRFVTVAELLDLAE